MITAKVSVSSKVDTGEGDNRQTVVTFGADYADGRNKEWAMYTPALSLVMTVKGAVGDRFTTGAGFVLAFTEATD